MPSTVTLGIVVLVPSHHFARDLGDSRPRTHADHGDDCDCGNHEDDDVDRAHCAGPSGALTTRHAAKASSARSAGLLTVNFMSFLRHSPRTAPIGVIASTSSLVAGSR